MAPMNNRLMRPRASGFNPRSIANLAAWYDASDSATLFDATSGGSLVAADGAVARWQDKSGNANHITQGTANNRPLRRTAAINGKDAIEFDGSDDHLGVTSTITTGNGATIVICHRSGAANGGGMHSFQGLGSVNAHPFSGQYYDGFASSVRYIWLQALNSSINQMYSVIASSTWTAYINNSQVYTTANTLQNSAVPQVFGRGWANAGFAYAGHLMEMMVYTRAITTTEQTSIYRYLKSKWNLP